MKTDIKIKYNNAFGTAHSRDYYKGKSFHYSGEWTSGAHYFSDDYNVDFIVKDNCLLACSQSHFATIDNEPKDYIYDENGSKIGIASRYWDFVLSGLRGIIPRLKSENGFLYISYDEGETWEELSELNVRWGDENEYDVELIVDGNKRTVLKKVKKIPDVDIDAVLNDFGIDHYE